MINSGTIRAAFVAHLRLIPSLVAIVGDASKIIEFTDTHGSDSFRSTVQMTNNTIMVLYQGTDPTGDSREIWIHRFAVVFKPGLSPTDVFDAFVNGIPTGSGGLPMLYTPIMAALHPMEIPSMGRRVIPVSEDHSFNYWEITTAFVENRP